MLCDFAQVAEGKLFISGGGWTVAVAMRGYIALILAVGWTQANHQITATLTLRDADGSFVHWGEDKKENALILVLEVGRPAGVPRGMDLELPIAVPMPQVDLAPGSYEWILTIDDKTEDGWRLPFLIVQQPAPLPRIG